MDSVISQPTSWMLEEGHLALDFVNTAYIDHTSAEQYGYHQVDEHLQSLADLGVWGRDHGVLGDALVETLANANVETGAPIVEELRSIREAIRRVLRAHLTDEPPCSEMLDELNVRLFPAICETRVVATETGFSPDRPSTAPPSVAEAVAQIRWAVALSTIGLLGDAGELALLKECPGMDCGYFFRDATHRRRWCSMSSCGNRAKVQRFRTRQKTSA